MGTMTDCKLETYLPTPSTGSSKCRSPSVHRKHTKTCSDLLSDHSLDHPSPVAIDLLKEIPEAMRQNIVEYLKSGDSEDLHITDDSFHEYLHIAIKMKHASLAKACINYLDDIKRPNNILNDIKSCQCYPTLVNFRCEPVCGCHKSDARPVAAQYAIIVPRKAAPDCKNVAHVINLNDRSVVTKETPHKMQNIGNGFALCTWYKKDCPYVVVSGGEGKHATSLNKYDVILNKWMMTSCKLKCARVNHLMVPVSGSIYILGGNNCNSIEVFNPAEHKTVQLETKLLVEVRSAIAAVWKDKVFIFGGKSQRGQVSCVQCFDTRTNQISRLPDLPCQCSGGQAVLVEDKVFIATHQGHMIAFDPSSGQSFLCAHQPIRRKHFFMHSKNGEVTLTAGVRTDGCKSSELPDCTFKPEKDIWAKSPVSQKPVALQASCVIELKKRCPVIPFMNLYTY